jgi:hypothetical protein
MPDVLEPDFIGALSEMSFAIKYAVHQMAYKGYGQ